MNSRQGRIERRSGVPLYRQVAAVLRERIESGVFRPGERIPTEYELCDEFGISRISIRQALGELVHEGLLSRRQGSGTYVRPEIGFAARTVTVVVTEDPWISPLEASVAAFNRDHPSSALQLQVEVLGRPQLRRNILAAVGRGEAPDLALVDWPWVVEFADLHFLYSLEDLDTAWVKEFRKDLFPVFADKDHSPMFGVQPEANVSIIWYRRDWLEEAGMVPPSTWEEFVDAAIRLRRGTHPSVAFCGGTIAGETATYQLLPFLWAAGAQLLSGKGAGLGKHAVTALQFLVDLVHVYHVAPAEAAYFSWDHWISEIPYK